MSRRKVIWRHSGGFYLSPESNCFSQWTGHSEIKDGTIDFVMWEESLSLGEAVSICLK